MSTDNLTYIIVQFRDGQMTGDAIPVPTGGDAMKAADLLTERAGPGYTYQPYRVLPDGQGVPL